MSGNPDACRFGLTAVGGLALAISMAGCSAPQAAPTLPTSAPTPSAATTPTPPGTQTGIYDVAVGLLPATVERCASLNIGEVVDFPVGKSTLTGSTLSTSHTVTCVFAVGEASPKGQEEYILRDFLSVSVNYQGEKDLASVVQRMGAGEKVTLGDEAYWWDQGEGGQLSVLEGATLLNVYTAPINDPPVTETRRDTLEAIAKNLLPSGQQAITGNTKLGHVRPVLFEGEST